MKTAMMILLVAFSLLGLSACEQEGPLERAGESLDRAADDVGDGVEDAADEIEDKID